jgi:broad specificity phosphatase PhoE
MISTEKPGPRLLVVVRHAESARNAVKGGRLDYPDTPEARALAGLQDHEIPLSPAGRQQAGALGPFLKKRFGQFNRCYDSGYRRAVETREIALRAGYAPGEIEQMHIRSEILLPRT